ncbi:hypothetical protein D9757_005159 [Collybiopsis confluens]|uniref:DUF6534 domain-containing protein n=1 Tax=Collybiopsis confluens TaxID=2823264 RepID=A0A8H5MCH7_9AGAR|nr:hypothetical protein D9757_005159 [Collybiopsis confluens]
MSHFGASRSSMGESIGLRSRALGPRTPAQHQPLDVLLQCHQFRQPSGVSRTTLKLFIDLQIDRSYYGMACPTGIVTVLVQGFYVWRVWKLSKSYILTAAIWMISFIQLGFFLYYVARTARLSADELTSVLGPYAIIVNSVGAACDILIACAIVWSLQQLRNSGGGGFKRTNHLLRSIMVFSMTAGIVSSFCAILVLTMAAIYPGTNIELPFYFALPRLYTNSILATLNVRDHLMERQSGPSWFTSGDFESSSSPHFRRAEMTIEQDSTIELQDLENLSSTRKEPQGRRISDERCSIQVKVEQLTNLTYK